MSTKPDTAREATPSASIAYRPDLDGLRAIAVGLVMLAHLQWPFRKDSADIGVTAFFVLSGYLITSLLVRERERTGQIRLGAFYRRRIVRLGPALLAVLAFALVFGLAGDLPPGWQLGIVSTLLYFSNWVQAAGIAIHPLGHTWSLAIEEQFYLVWPLVLILAWRRAFWIALALIPIAFIARVVATGYPEYFSTLTRVDAILLGCVLAFIRPRWPTWVAVVGVVALILTSVAFETDQHDLAVPAAMLATAMVIGGRLPPLGRLAPVGLRAYSLYLWNTPMTLLFGAGAFMAPVLTIVFAEVSYRLLERPVLRRGGSNQGREQEAGGTPAQSLAAEPTGLTAESTPLSIDAS